MNDISMTQQTLAYNQSLLPIYFQRLSGMPEDLTLARLLQFLDGESKEAVSGLKTVAGSIHQALNILDQRYG